MIKVVLLVSILITLLTFSVPTLAEEQIRFNGHLYFVVDKQTFIQQQLVRRGDQIGLRERIVSRFIIDSDEHDVPKPLVGLYLEENSWQGDSSGDLSALTESVREGAETTDFQYCDTKADCVFIQIMGLEPHTIRPGETLESISTYYSVEPTSIIAVNPELRMTQFDTVTTLYIPVWK